MRKILLYGLAAFALTSCSDLAKKKSKSDETEETSKIKKPLKDDGSDEDETSSKKKNADLSGKEGDSKTGTPKASDDVNKSASYASGWSSSEKETFMSTCVDKAKAGMGEAGAKNYCSCMLGKIEEIYPNAADAGKLDQAKMTDLAKECLGQ